MKAKKIISVISVLIIILSLAACSSSFSNAERFAARANITLRQGMWDYPELEGVTTYSLNSIEYYTSGAARVIRAHCAVSNGGEIVPCVFLLSDRKDYLDDFILTIEDLWDTPRYIEETEMYFISLFDFEFTPNENESVSIGQTWDLTELYLKNGDKALLGMK
ncbi:MAG: hypothetical protein FWD48_04790 [Oscillospiraceae bacterium]|nr:hypothetical protein [Oscillospiraceae bacterium]